ncbi:MAG TPA: PEP-CTERM sorting domain-containing protein [Candidatus Aquilonibacter sp.]|nr:PEP-CTERM sorting domain-containing protein [Candidatus Aquilonibacter sp.]
MKVIAHLSLVSAAIILIPALALADSTVNGNSQVNATDNIYASGSQGGLITNCSAPSINYCGAGGQGTPPGFILLNGATYVTFSASGTISLDGNDEQFNDPDGYYNGIPAYNLVPTYASSNPGFESLSGITAPGAGYLVGVFVGPDGPSGSAPASLDYTAAGAESLTSYSPLLDQVFFIGDGLTGDGTGTVQDFVVPAGATELYLGISDACNFQGPPSCYGGNDGAYNANYSLVTTGGNSSPSPTPEPQSLLLLGTGVLGAASALRRRIVR